MRKKFERGDLTQEEFNEEAGKELADVVTYLDILAFRLGIDLGEVVRDKFNEISYRVDSPIYISNYGVDFRSDLEHYQCNKCNFYYHIDSLFATRNDANNVVSAICDRCEEK